MNREGERSRRGERFNPTAAGCPVAAWAGIIRLLLLLVSGLAAGCVSSSQLERSGLNEAFATATREFIASHFEFRPEQGVAKGWHQYDGQVASRNAAALGEEEARLLRYRKIFRQFDPADLSPEARLDREILLAEIGHELWLFHIGAYGRDPMAYAGSPDVLIYLMRNFAPLEERLGHATELLRQTGRLLAEARDNLVPNLARPQVELAILIAEGEADFLENGALAAARQATDPAVIKEFEKAAALAARNKREFAEWLRRERLPQATGDFAIGDEAYREMLAAEQITLTPGEILSRGLRALAVEQERFTATARLIDPQLPAVEVYQQLQRDHPTEQSLIPDTTKNLEAIRQFVVDHDLVTIPSAIRARVEETPPPMRATGFAFMSLPGPFETRATEAYYYVTPPEPDWTMERKDDWLTAFNYYTTDIVSIHEAYPGHYVQGLALNASPASEVAKVFRSYAFEEGWAHYTEQLLVDEGFPERRAGEHDYPLRAAKYRLAQSGEALLRYCRLVCSVRLHTQGMTVEEATRFFMTHCHYAEEPSRQEAMRGTYDPGYLVYALGKMQILELRDEWRKQEGPAFTLKRFHDAFLSHGSPPIPAVRRRMLEKGGTR